MTILNLNSIRNSFPYEEFDYTSLTSILSVYGGIRQKINQLLKQNVIVRVKKGLYVFGPDYNKGRVCKETLANLIYGPSYLSMEYALSFHGLIPERVETLTSVTSKKDKQFKTPLGLFTYRHLNLECFKIGIDQVWLDATHPILIASAEKALCDYLRLNKISIIKSVEDASAFLEHDLRIDIEKLQKLSVLDLETLNGFYKLKSIEFVIKRLEQVGR